MQKKTTPNCVGCGLCLINVLLIICSMQRCALR
ncbi:MAG: methylenetetrahydrofolate reductase C-terminal domain-containing protein [Bacteroidaceae bacterium]|nr:methylenetetrahydrofolate reductase C-terminal domain-containing protein [Bacteroidaceae bacterium]